MSSYSQGWPKTPWILLPPAFHMCHSVNHHSKCVTNLRLICSKQLQLLQVVYFISRLDVTILTLGITSSSSISKTVTNWPLTLTLYITIWYLEQSFTQRLLWNYQYKKKLKPRHWLWLRFSGRVLVVWPPIPQNQNFLKQMYTWNFSNFYHKKCFSQRSFLGT